MGITQEQKKDKHDSTTTSNGAIILVPFIITDQNLEKNNELLGE